MKYPIISEVARILPLPLFNFLQRIWWTWQLIKWERRGKPLPAPHMAKQRLIRDCQKMYGYSVFIETGTYLGDMVEAQKEYFKTVKSIEVAHHLFERAKRRFSNDLNVELIQGDSGKVMIDLMNRLSEPAIFWLDGHYSGGITGRGDTDCPVFDEIRSILSHSSYPHVLLVDDARCFKGKDTYPTVEQLTDFVLNLRPGYQINIADDITKITPESTTE